MQAQAIQNVFAHRAVVSRAQAIHPNRDSYLVVRGEGDYAWTEDPQLATTFDNMRDATRAALRLPASLKAYSLLRDVEVDAHRVH